MAEFSLSPTSIDSIDLEENTLPEAFSQPTPNFSTANITESVTVESAENISKLKTNNINLVDVNTSNKFAIPTFLLGGVATIADSLGLVSEDTINKSIAKISPSFAAEFQNSPGIRFASDFVTAFLPGTLAIKAIRTGSSLEKLTTSLIGNKFSRPLFSTARPFNEILQEVRKRDIILASAQTGDFTTDLVRTRLATGAKKEAIFNVFKEGVAVDIGLFATMNESEALFPDEMSLVDNLLLFGFFDIAAAGVGFGIIRNKLRQSIVDVGEIFAQSFNKQGIPLTDILFRAGHRDVGISVKAVEEQIAKQEFQTAGTDELLEQNLNARILDVQNTLKKELELMAGDNPFPGLTNKTILSSSELNTLLGFEKGSVGAFDIDPFILLDSISIEKLQKNSHREFFINKDKFSKKLDKQIENLFAEFEQLTIIEKSEKSGKLTAQIDEMIEQKSNLEKSVAMVIENDGGVVLLSQRKPLIQDIGLKEVNKEITTISSKTDAGRKSSQTKLKKELSDSTDSSVFTSSVTLTASDDGLLFIKGIEKDVEDKTVLYGINATRAINTFQETQLNAQTNERLKNIISDFNSADSLPNTFGERVFASLSPEAKNVLRLQTQSNSGVRGILSDRSSPITQEIYAAFAPLREELRKFALPDGTIPLFRGERIREDQKFDVVSMTASFDVAAGFKKSKNIESGAGRSIIKNVPIDDIISVGGFASEFELIVRGNKIRSAGEKASQFFEVLTPFQRSAAYATLQHRIDNYDIETGPQILIHPGSHHTTVDFALELIDRHGENIFPKIALSNENVQITKERIADLEFISLNSKYKEWLRQRGLQDSILFNFIKIPSSLKPNELDFIRGLNLPETINGGIHPLIELFEDLRQQKIGSLFSVFDSMEKLKEAMISLTTSATSASPLVQLSDAINPALRFRGKMLSFDQNKKPIISLFKQKPSSRALITREELVNRVAGEKLAVIDIISKAVEDPKNAPNLSAVYNVFTSNGNIVQSAKKVDLLIEGQQRGRDTIFSAPFAANNPTITAVDIIQDLMQKANTQVTKELLQEPEKIFTKLLSFNHQGDLINFEVAYNARMQGWDLVDGFVPGPAENSWKIQLKDTEDNKARWKLLFNQEMPEDAFLPNPVRNVPEDLILTDLARAGIESFTFLDTALLKSLNPIRQAGGQRLLNFKEHHLPPIQLSGKEIGFLINEQGKVQTIVAGRTAKELKNNVDNEIKLNKEAGRNLFAASADEMQKYAHLRDEAFEKLINFADPLSQTGKKATGKTAPVTIQTGTELLRGLINQVVQNFNSIPKRTMGLLFESELNFVKARAQSLTLGSSEALRKKQTIFDTYIQRLFNNNSINAETFVGKVYLGVENAFDDILLALHDKLRFSSGGTQRRAGIREKIAFQQLSDSLGEYRPFNNLEEFLQKTQKISFSPSMRAGTGKLNNITGLLSLRLFETGLAWINILSLGVTIPAVTKMMQRMPGESIQQWQRRTLTIGSPITENTKVMNPLRLGTSTFHFMFQPEGRAVWREAAKRGLLNMDFVEKMEIITAPKQGYTQKLLSESTKIATFLADKSEEIARGLSFMSGYYMARKGFFLDPEQAMTFGHNFANHSVGDYRPSIRPQIFQGAAGTSLSLFTTFMWNYLQRTLGFIENKQVSALATQFGLQASLFGAQSLPGFNQFIEIFTSNYDGKTNLVDRLYQNFDDTFVDMFLNGSLATIPVMFGAEESPALFTRADINLPFSRGAGLFGKMPAYNLMSSIATGTYKIFKSIEEQGGFNGQQIAGIAARYSTNRFSRNVFDIYSGISTDSRGAIINEDTRRAATIAIRLNGFRTIQEDKTTKEFMRERKQELIQSELRRNLRDAIRANVQKGNLTEEVLNTHINRYIRAGGKPEGFERFLTEQLMTGTVDKKQLEVLRALKDPGRRNDALRLLKLIDEDVEITN